MKTNFKTLVFCSLIAILLVGCCTPPVVPDTPLVPPTKTVNIPADLLKACPLIPKLQEREYTDDEIIVLMKRIVDQSESCRSKNAQLIQILTKAFNIKSP